MGRGPWWEENLTNVTHFFKIQKWFTLKSLLPSHSFETLCWLEEDKGWPRKVPLEPGGGTPVEVSLQSLRTAHSWLVLEALRVCAEEDSQNVDRKGILHPTFSSSKKREQTAGPFCVFLLPMSSTQWPMLAQLNMNAAGKRESGFQYQLEHQKGDRKNKVETWETRAKLKKSGRQYSSVLGNCACPTPKFTNLTVHS